MRDTTQRKDSGSMQGVLGHRILRGMKKGLLRYLALGVLIFVSVYMVISVLGAAETLIAGVDEIQDACRTQDGQFTTFLPLTSVQEETIARSGVTLEEHFSMDFRAEGGSRLRIFRERKICDLFWADEAEEEYGLVRGIAGGGGLCRKSVAEGDILLEKRYAQEHGLHAGDSLTIAGEPFRIAAVGTVPDYNNPVKGMTDSTADSFGFGLGFVSENAYQRLQKTGQALETETYSYAYSFDSSQVSMPAADTHTGESISAAVPVQTSGKDKSSRGQAQIVTTDQELQDLIESFPFEIRNVKDPWFQSYVKEVRGESGTLAELLETPLFSDQKDMQRLKDLIDPDIHNLQEFVPRKDNMRIGASTDDLLINRYAMSAAGVILILLFAYVISVFTMHEIDRSSEVIGTLYAMGVRRRELTRHFTVLPVLVTGVFGILGTLTGYSRLGIPWQMGDTYDYYSVPAMAPRMIPYILVYGLLMPPLMAFAVNRLVISRRLDRPVLGLLRRERKSRRASRLQLSGMGFTGKFRIRQMLRSIRPALTVLSGLFVSLLIVFIGVDVFCMCRHVKVDNVRDTRFEYMYMYKYPEKKVPEGGTPAYAKSLVKEAWGFEIEVTLLGIPEDMPYFDARPYGGQGKVVIASAMAQKYSLKEGDIITLKDKEADRYYAFEVEGIIQYSPGFFAFMDLDAMRDMLGAEDTYYNTVFSDHDLKIDPGRLYSTLTRSSIVDASGIYMDMLGPMIKLLIIISGIIFLVVMYLMMGVMVDHSSYDISLMKIFGYRDGEIRRLYLSGSFLMVAAGTLIVMPLSKMIIDRIYPSFISNVACAMDLSMPAFVYVVIYAVILLCCLLDYVLLLAKIRRVLPAQVLKNRE